MPFHQNCRKLQQFQLKVFGDNDNYVWSSSSRMVQINSNGTAIEVCQTNSKYNKLFLNFTKMKTDGHTVYIRVALRDNPKIIRRAKVRFLIPARLEIIKYNFETALGDYVHLNVVIYGYDQKAITVFDKCNALEFNFIFINSIFEVDYNYSGNGTQKAIFHDDESCQIIHLKSLAPGTSFLQISFNNSENILAQSVILRVFEPLKLLPTFEGKDIILAKGGSQNIVFTRGPYLLHSSEAIRLYDIIYDQEIIRATKLKTNEQNRVYGVNVLCLKVGKNVLKWSISNNFHSPKIKSYAFSLKIAIDCVKPYYLKIYGQKQMQSLCPFKAKESKYLQNTEKDDQFQTNIEFRDAKYRRILNHSLDAFISWELKPSLPNQSHYNAIFRKVLRHEYNFNIAIETKHFTIIASIEPIKSFSLKAIFTRNCPNLKKKIQFDSNFPFVVLEIVVS